MSTYTNKDFNPSSNPSVDAIKEAAEALAEVIVAHAKPGALADKALIDCQSASMFAVKSIFS